MDPPRRLFQKNILNNTAAQPETVRGDDLVAGQPTQKGIRLPIGSQPASHTLAKVVTMCSGSNSLNRGIRAGPANANHYRQAVRAGGVIGRMHVPAITRPVRFSPACPATSAARSLPPAQASYVQSGIEDILNALSPTLLFYV